LGWSVRASGGRVAPGRADSAGVRIRRRAVLDGALRRRDGPRAPRPAAQRGAALFGKARSGVFGAHSFDAPFAPAPVDPHPSGRAAHAGKPGRGHSAGTCLCLWA
jgi:hypothetical protein